MLDLWFEIVLSIYGFLYLFIYSFQLCIMFSNDEEPELSEEMRQKIYS